MTIFSPAAELIGGRMSRPAGTSVTSRSWSPDIRTRLRAGAP